MPDSGKPSTPGVPARGGSWRKVKRWTIGTLVAVVVLGAALLWLLNRAFTAETRVRHASRFTSGNQVFPVQVAVFKDHVARYKPWLLGSTRDAITLRQIASVKVMAGPLFADVVIDTTGGSPPVVIHGLWNKDAAALASEIAAAQAASPAPVRPVSPPPAPPPSS